MKRALSLLMVFLTDTVAVAPSTPAKAEVFADLVVESILGTNPLTIVWSSEVMMTSPHFHWATYTPKRQKDGGTIETPFGTQEAGHTGQGVLYQELFQLVYTQTGTYQNWCTDMGVMTGSPFPLPLGWTKDTPKRPVTVN